MSANGLDDIADVRCLIPNDPWKHERPAGLKFRALWHITLNTLLQERISQMRGKPKHEGVTIVACGNPVLPEEYARKTLKDYYLARKVSSVSGTCYTRD